MKVYTRTGDKGQTGLYDGSRVDKDHARIECLGEIDEVNSTIGLLRSKLPQEHTWQDKLQRVQTLLMDAMASVATPTQNKRCKALTFAEDADKWLEAWIDSIESSLPSSLTNFLLPGGSEISATCHIIRTQTRRAERRLISLNKIETLSPEVMRFVNRLSDLMFNLSREELHKAGLHEEKWTPLKDDSET